MATSRKQTSFFDASFSLTHPGGWMPSGLLHSTYEREYSARVQVISPQHLYAPELGRDLYPTPAMMERLRAGERVVFGLKQWA